VRSYLEITSPDRTSADTITEVVLSGSDLLASSAQDLPWKFAHGGTGFEFNLELGLAEQWSVELRILLGYALQVRTES
jgi:hypothetical protein